MVLVSVRGGMTRGNIGSFNTRIKFRTFLAFFILLHLLAHGCALAAFERACQSPSFVGCGMAGIFFPHSLSPELNPSGIALFKQNYADWSWSIAPFGLRELSGMRVSLAIPLGGMVAGGGVVTSGFSLYRESALRLTAAAEIAPGFSGGVSVWIDHLAIARYGSDNCLGTDAAVTFEAGGGLTCGVSIINFNRPGIGEEDNPLPQLFVAGVGWKPSETVAVAVDLVKDVRVPLSLRLGLEVAPVGGLTVRLGAFDAPLRYSGGAGIALGSFIFDYAVTTHAILGLSHTIGAGFEW